MAGGAAILAVLVWRVGTGPLVDGLRLTTGWPLVAALAITSLTTLCCAWRWRLIAGGLGVELPLRTAVAAYYRSQFLNATLPGGVVGDVHRAVRHGREVGDLGRSLRAVAWERSSGFAVQLVLTVGVLCLPAGSFVPRAAVTVAVVAGVALIAVLVLLNGRRLSSRIGRAFTSDLRYAVLAPRVWPRILLASTVAVLGHVAVFLIAVRATGADVSPARLLPLALVVLTASAVPTNIAGWGPREGAAAWAFSAVGLGAALGVTVAVVYGMLALVATLPGAVVLVVARQRAHEAQPDRVRSAVDA
ncbi:flippase-like domain-containing protein [Kribbella sp. NBC_00709]|uniref:lysylphosphatidylglycerol synthase transmembrane domain-containing protein n=1 Tax=Kribbella sp. NBC_00709 TaxID=2975972 RepID=UPI002E2D28DF|nr:lysylphosphatidylglycerol synthase transmembrane domain-containing protein [Kribbella sp. NBC_00709]